jgi:hypothetical protein
MNKLFIAGKQAFMLAKIQKFPCGKLIIVRLHEVQAARVIHENRLVHVRACCHTN